MSDCTQSCSKCKKATIRPERTSIHNTLAYSRCRCHRSFIHKKRQPFMPSATSLGMPGSISILAPKLTIRSETCTSSQVFPNTTNNLSLTTHSGSRPKETSGSQFTLPLIDIKQQSLVALSESDDDHSAGNNNISSASVILASTRIIQSTNPQSSASVVKSFPPRLPQPSRCTTRMVCLTKYIRCKYYCRKHEAALYQKPRTSRTNISQVTKSNSR